MRSSTPAQQALDLIRTHFVDPQMSLKSLAGLLGVSDRHLGRLIRHSQGITFRQHLRQLRVARAAVLLSSSEYDIKVIARMVGYDHCSHFANAFRIIVGCTPTTFKQRYTHEVPSLQSGCALVSPVDAYSCRAANVTAETTTHALHQKCE